MATALFFRQGYGVGIDPRHSLSLSFSATASSDEFATTLIIFLVSIATYELSPLMMQGIKVAWSASSSMESSSSLNHHHHCLSIPRRRREVSLSSMRSDTSEPRLGPRNSIFALLATCGRAFRAICIGCCSHATTVYNRATIKGLSSLYFIHCSTVTECGQYPRFVV